jgi:hypothetical protein
MRAAIQKNAVRYFVYEQEQQNSPPSYKNFPIRVNYHSIKTTKTIYLYYNPSIHPMALQPKWGLGLLF